MPVISLAPSKDTAERDVESDVCRYAESLGWIQRKFNSPARRAEPDRIFLRSGKCVFIEFKRKGETPTKAQREKLDIYTEAGFFATSCDSIEHGKGLFDLIETGKLLL